MVRSKKDKLEAEDVAILYDLAWNQFKEDREMAVKQYNDLKKYIDDEPNRYNVVGEALAKYADLMIKQTGQVLELVKLAKKSHEEDGELSQEDMDEIKEELEKDQKERIETTKEEKNDEP